MSDSTPEEPIRLTSLTRLDVRPGEVLAAVVPSSSPIAVTRMQEMLTEWMAEYCPGVRVLVFPEGTELAIIKGDHQ